MKRTLSAWISGAIVVAVTGCSGPAVRSKVSEFRFDQNTYIVQVGDTIESIAYRYQLTSNRLARLNPRLKSHVIPGERVVIRSGRREIMPAVQRTRTRNSTEVAASYTPDPGYGTQPELIKPIPDSDYPQPDYSRGGGVLVTAIPGRDKPIRTEEIIEESVATNLLVAPVVPKISELSGPVEKNGWRWPSDGEVVREYAPGEANGQGIDIAGVPGQEIRASADGTVIYAGRDLSNSGNLVIVRHEGNVLSTYSHAKDLFVAEDDIVSGGDHIASLGWNSDRESVLHFGIRNNGKPADPLGYLPDR